MYSLLLIRFWLNLSLCLELAVGTFFVPWDYKRYYIISLIVSIVAGYFTIETLYAVMVERQKNTDKLAVLYLLNILLPLVIIFHTETIWDKLAEIDYISQISKLIMMTSGTVVISASIESFQYVKWAFLSWIRKIMIVSCRFD